MLGKSFAACFNTDGKNIFPIHKFITSLENLKTLGTHAQLFSVTQRFVNFRMEANHWT